jgi:hypothetical protein
MSIPASVNQIALPRARARRQPRRRIRAGEQDGAIGDELSVDVGVGGVILDFGKGGGVGLERHKGVWKWISATDERDGSSLRPGSACRLQDC